MGTRLSIYIGLMLMLLIPVYSFACPGANPKDRLADDAALQRCLDGGGAIELAAAKPGYIINRTLTIRHHGTRITSAPGSIAKLIAGNTLIGPILFARNIRDFSIQRLSIDGNKAGRSGNPCMGTSGNTIVIIGGSNFVVADNKIVNTVCGTALLVTGKDYVIARNTIKNSGYEPIRSGQNSFADGITAGICERGLIANNVLKNNTDVSIIVGGGTGCRVVDNKIKQTTSMASAGMWIFNFTCGDCGKGIHSGSLFARNKIDSKIPNGLGAGIAVGGHILSKDLWVDDAGTITENQVSGAGVNLLIDGVRSGSIRSNKIDRPSGKAGGLYFGNGCTNLDHFNYTVSHAGNSDLQPGWLEKSFDSYSCGNSIP